MSHTDTTTTTNAYFNLREYIAAVQSPDVASQMAQSAAFAIDVGIQTAVRSLMKNLRAHHAVHGYETIGDMTVAMREAAFVEEIIRLAGKDDLGPVATILQLTHIREDWHQFAADLTGMTFDWQGVPRTYEIRSMDEVLNREVKFGVRPDTERKIRLTVQRRADDACKDDVEQVIKRRMQREEARARDMSNMLMEQRETLITLFTTVTDLADAGALDALDILPANYGESEVEFHDLDVSLQRTMIEGALRGAERAEQYATQSSSITDTEFDAVSFGVIRVERELKAVLQAPKFIAQQRKTDAGRTVSA
jgi:hypothetical protein